MVFEPRIHHACTPVLQLRWPQLAAAGDCPQASHISVQLPWPQLIAAGACPGHSWLLQGTTAPRLPTSVHSCTEHSWLLQGSATRLPYGDGSFASKLPVEPQARSCTLHSSPYCHQTWCPQSSTISGLSFGAVHWSYC